MPCYTRGLPGPLGDFGCADKVRAMKAVLLAGGLGTRLSEETIVRPKPMVEIGGRPILWHIMKIYSHYGINDFIVCCGYRGYVIKEYFANYFLHMSDVTFDMSTNSMEVHQQYAEPWRVTLVDTGIDTATGGRVAAATGSAGFSLAQPAPDRRTHPRTTTLNARVLHTMTPVLLRTLFT